MPQIKQIPLIQKSLPYVYRGPKSIGTPYANVVANNINGYFQINEETLDNSSKVAFCKRPGVLDTEYVTGKTNLKTTNSAERIMGLCTSLDKSQVIYITQDATKRYSNIFTYSANTVTQTDISATFTAGEYALTVLDGINYGSGVYYAATNGTTGGLISSTGVWSKITDADYTGTGVKTNFVGLDGYLFYGVISGTGAGRIYNSDLGAAAAASGWTATSYLSASDVPGSLVWLGRIRNYLVAFKQYSLEFFEDIGNPIPGSPLEPRKQLTKKVGCASASSVQEVSDGIIFMGVDSSGKFRMYKLMQESLELKIISDASTEAAIQNFEFSIGGFQSFSNDYEVAAAAKGQSQVIIWQNKEFYSITAYSVDSGFPITLVYDNALDSWMQWATAFDTDSVSDYTFKPSMCFMLYNSAGGYYTCFANNYATNTKSRFSIFYPYDPDAIVFPFKDQYELGTSNVHQFVFAWISEMFDLGTHDRKILHALEVIYDSDPRYAANTAGDTSDFLYLNVVRGDHIHNSTSIGRTIDDAAFNRAKYHALGSHKRFGFVLYTTSNIPLRIWAIQLTYSDGISNA